MNNTIKTINNDIVEYDENNNCIYIKYSYGFEVWREYDKNNNCIHTKHSNGFEAWRDYDENNNLIHCKFNDGTETWYDENIHEITKEQFDNINNKTLNNKTIIIDGIQYKLIKI